MKINNDKEEFIENNGIELSDEELDKVSGGCCDDDGDNTNCSCNPTGIKEHEWELKDGKLTCKYCGVYMG